MQITNNYKGFIVFAYVRLRLSLTIYSHVTHTSEIGYYRLHTVEVVGSNPAVPTI
jgi:hypothetical protein